jgi:hypothetical protein
MSMRRACRLSGTRISGLTRSGGRRGLVGKGMGVVGCTSVLVYAYVKDMFGHMGWGAWLD